MLEEDINEPSNQNILDIFEDATTISSVDGVVDTNIHTQPLSRVDPNGTVSNTLLEKKPEIDAQPSLEEIDVSTDTMTVANAEKLINSLLQDSSSGGGKYKLIGGGDKLIKFTKQEDFIKKIISAIKSDDDNIYVVYNSNNNEHIKLIKDTVDLITGLVKDATLKKRLAKIKYINFTIRIDKLPQSFNKRIAFYDKNEIYIKEGEAGSFIFFNTLIGDSMSEMPKKTAGDIGKSDYKLFHSHADINNLDINSGIKVEDTGNGEIKCTVYGTEPITFETADNLELLIFIYDTNTKKKENGIVLKGTIKSNEPKFEFEYDDGNKTIETLFNQYKEAGAKYAIKVFRKYNKSDYITENEDKYDFKSMINNIEAGEDIYTGAFKQTIDTYIENLRKTDEKFTKLWYYLYHYMENFSVDEAAYKGKETDYKKALYDTYYLEFINLLKFYYDQNNTDDFKSYKALEKYLNTENISLKGIASNKINIKSIKGLYEGTSPETKHQIELQKARILDRTEQARLEPTNLSKLQKKKRVKKKNKPLDKLSQIKTEKRILKLLHEAGIIEIFQDGNQVFEQRWIPHDQQLLESNEGLYIFREKDTTKYKLYKDWIETYDDDTKKKYSISYYNNLWNYIIKSLYNRKGGSRNINKSNKKKSGNKKNTKKKNKRNKRNKRM